VSIQKM